MCNIQRYNVHGYILRWWKIQEEKNDVRNRSKRAWNTTKGTTWWDWFLFIVCVYKCPFQWPFVCESCTWSSDILCFLLWHGLNNHNLSIDYALYLIRLRIIFTYRFSWFYGRSDAGEIPLGPEKENIRRTTVEVPRYNKHPFFGLNNHTSILYIYCCDIVAYSALC